MGRVPSAAMSQRSLAIQNLMAVRMGDRLEPPTVTFPRHQKNRGMTKQIRKQLVESGIAFDVHAAGFGFLTRMSN
jgi:hypothetical protein